MLLGLYPVLGILLLVIFYLPATWIFHNYWTVQDPQARQADQIQFLKNVALLGSTLMFLAIPQPWPFSLGG